MKSTLNALRTCSIEEPSLLLKLANRCRSYVFPGIDSFGGQLDGTVATLVERGALGVRWLRRINNRMRHVKRVEPIVNLDYQLLRAQAVLDWRTNESHNDGPSKPIDEESMKRLHENLKELHEDFNRYLKNKAA
jgi:hypothetical protein